MDLAIRRCPLCQLILLTTTSNHIQYYLSLVAGYFSWYFHAILLHDYLTKRIMINLIFFLGVIKRIQITTIICCDIGDPWANPKGRRYHNNNLVDFHNIFDCAVQVLQKCCEINRELDTKSSKTSNSSIGSRNGKINSTNQVVLENEWYRKVHETFYQAKEKSNNPTSSSSQTHNSNGLNSNNTSSNLLNPNMPC